MVLGNPLNDAVIVKQMFSFLPGDWLFLGAVCKEWQALYASMEDQQVWTLSEGNNRCVTCGPKTTLCSTTVASPETARLASMSGMRFCPYWPLQHIAGLYADIQTLGALCGLGMQFGNDVVEAAAR
jgi:hypothetical protein